MLVAFCLLARSQWTDQGVSVLLASSGEASLWGHHPPLLRRAEKLISLVDQGGLEMSHGYLDHVCLTRLLSAHLFSALGVLHLSGSSEIRVRQEKLCGNIPACSRVLGTTEWHSRLIPEPVPLGGEKGEQSWFGEQCKGMPSIPSCFWGRNHCGASRKMVLDTEMGIVSLQAVLINLFLGVRNRSRSLFASLK